MSISYIILVHKDPLQLRRLINGLSLDNTKFYIHVDKNVSITPFVLALEGIPNIIFMKDSAREKCVWGGIGIVKGTLNCMQQIVADNRNGYCVLLSGQDYPVKTNTNLNLFLENHKGINFISGEFMPSKFWSNGGMDRIEEYHYSIPNKKQDMISLPSVFNKKFYGKIKMNLLKIMILLKNGIIPYQILRKRIFPPNLKPVGGSQWWALPVETIKKIVDFNAQNPAYLKYHEHTHVPDETFFHSIVFSLVPQKEIMPSLTYANWTEKKASPLTFKTNNFKELKALGRQYLFARKFSEITDRKILDLIDIRLRKVRIAEKQLLQETPSPQIKIQLQ